MLCSIPICPSQNFKAKLYTSTNLMEINLRFLQTFSLVVACLQALEKTWWKQVP
jgi:hypothetical protein